MLLTTAKWLYLSTFALAGTLNPPHCIQEHSPDALRLPLMLNRLNQNQFLPLVSRMVICIHHHHNTSIIQGPVLQWQVWHRLHRGPDQPLNACSERRMTFCHLSSISTAGSAVEKRQLPLSKTILCCHLPLVILFFSFFFQKVTFLQGPGKYCRSVASTVKNEKQLKVEAAREPSCAQAENKDAKPPQSGKTSSLYSHLLLEA